MTTAVPEAIRRVYQAVGCINWKGLHYRKDIGHRALEHRPRTL